MLNVTKKIRLRSHFSCVSILFHIVYMHHVNDIIYIYLLNWRKSL